MNETKTKKTNEKKAPKEEPKVRGKKKPHGRY
jgi:hypothetical protein